MAQLEIASELQSLGHGHVAPSLKHHHSDWTAWEGVAHNKLGDDVKADLDVRDGLDHANWNRVCERDEEGKDKCPHWHLRVPDFDGNNAENEHGHCEINTDEMICQSR